MPDLVVRTVRLNHMSAKPVWVRLGFREKHAAQAEILPSYEPMIQAYLAETQVRIFYLEKAIRITGDQIDLAGYRFASHLVAERFGQPETALVMGASARPEDAERIRTLQAEGNLQQAVILDAVLSEKVDFGLDFIEQELTVEMRRTGRTLGRRLSCGYGDFSLENQRYFYDTLEFARQGIQINEQNILSPEKTVTALLPIYGSK